MSIAKTPKPPYYAVVFTSVMGSDLSGYVEMAEEVRKIAESQEGFLGMESVGEAVEITVSYWKSLEDIKQWRLNESHQLAVKTGKGNWNKHYKIRVTEVLRDYEFEKV